MKLFFSDFRGRIAGLATVVAFSGLAACDSDTTKEPVATSFELNGTWTSEFGEEAINDTTWTNYVAQKVIKFDNAANMAIVQNPADAEWGPNDFSRAEWLEPTADSFKYCVVVYGQKTAAEAESAPTPDTIDRNDVDGVGCGGAPWSVLTRKK